MELFDAGPNSLGVFDLALAPLVTFSEGRFTYAGPTAISEASLTFAPAAYPRFAIDNIEGRLPTLPWSPSP